MKFGPFRGFQVINNMWEIFLVTFIFLILTIWFTYPMMFLLLSPIFHTVRR